MKKTNPAKMDKLSQAQEEQEQAQEEQEQARNQLLKMGRDGLIGCQQKKNKKEPG